MLIEYTERALRGAAGLDTTWSTAWSSACLAGGRGEDRIVAERRPWPCGGAAELDPEIPVDASAPEVGVTSWQQQDQQRPAYHLFAVFDGHNGAAAAEFAQQQVAAIVDAYLPSLGDVPHPTVLSADAAKLAGELQAALALSFLELQRQFAAVGCLGGCTATVVLQVGCLVTVGSVGSSRCLLDTGNCKVLALSEGHRVGGNLRERQRLLAAGCHLAAVDASGLGPAATPCRGVGSLRLWPGGLTLSRSIGDFKVGEGVLPLPHIKQVLLPPSGGRLVLASDGVWSLAGEGVVENMRLVPVKTAAHHAVRSMAASGVDASIIVADVVPAGTTFQAVCRQQQGRGPGGSEAATVRRLALGLRGGGKAVLRALGIAGRPSKGHHSPEAQQPPAVGGSQTAAGDAAATATILADVDTAALLGLMPAAGRSTKLQGGSPAASLARSSWQGIRVAAGVDAWAAMMAPAAAAEGAAAAGQLQECKQHQKQLLLLAAAWFNDQVAAEMRGMMGEARNRWHQARLQSQAAEAAALAATSSLQSAASQPPAYAAWQAAAAAASASTEAGVPTPSAQGPLQQPEEVAAGTYPSALLPAASGSGSRNLRRASFAGGNGSAGLGSIDERAAVGSGEHQPVQQGRLPPRPPAFGARDGCAGSNAATGPGLRCIACPPLPRSHSSSSTSSSASCGSSAGGSGAAGGPASLSRSSSGRSVAAPATPQAGLGGEPQLQRWRSADGSSEDRWLSAYTLTASIFTRGSSGHRT